MRNTSEAKKLDNSWNFKGATYRKRDETTHVTVRFYPFDISAYEYGRMMVGQGWFNTGYHFVVHPNGTIETGIPFEQFGDPSIKGWENSVCILAVGVSKDDRARWLSENLPVVLKKLRLQNLTLEE